MNKYIVPGPNTHIRYPNFFLSCFSAISCYLCIFPLVMVDVFIWQFQNIYFWGMEIPLIKRKNFVIMDRYMLGKLTIWQRINCFYCEYANGIVAYAKAVVNQTELYSCAIKHVHHPLGQNHQKAFFERSKFE